MILYFLLIAETSKIEPTNWYTTIGVIFLSIITGLFSWWKTRGKDKSDKFKIFMDESTEFREEVRKEREEFKGAYVVAYKGSKRS